MNSPKDENGGGGSGTTSRRHSVSVVQPRRTTIVGFNVPGHDTQDESGAAGRSRVFHAPSFGRGGLVHSLEQQLIDAQYRNGGNNGHGTQRSATATIVPHSSFHPRKGHPIASLGEQRSPTIYPLDLPGFRPVPLSPTAGRPIQPQQGNFYPQ
ncbi:hypothetical protein F5141DRAFT_70972 [Pisolithus sp. B1]|nr:hypothetical protein F5141DRAFT_70972 [Pisolithus sp. B1]